jgi:hypothetical protein
MFFVYFLLLVACVVIVEAKQHQHHHQQQQQQHAPTDEARRKKLAEQARDTHDTHDYLYSSSGSWLTMGASVLMMAVVGLFALFILLCCLEPACGACRKLWWIIVTVPRWLVTTLLFLPLWLINRLLCCGSVRGPGYIERGAVGGVKKRSKRAETEADAARVALLVSQRCHHTDCTNKRMLIGNSFNRAVLIALCEEHARTEHGEHATILERFEAAPSKYTCNFHFLRNPFSSDGNERAQKFLRETIERSVAALAAPDAASKKGFIYMFTSQDDGKPPENIEQPWLFKIGETTQGSAAASVADWDKPAGKTVNFLNVEGFGWWHTKNAPVAEALIHAVLVRKRYVRFNALRDKNEVEWFYASYKQVQETIVRILRQVDEKNISTTLKVL